MVERLFVGTFFCTKEHGASTLVKVFIHVKRSLDEGIWLNFWK
jgi:hypothetical protein